MRNIYFLGQNKSIVIYTWRNQIFRATLDGGQVIRPILLAGDYLGELSDTYYRGTVYFSYISRQHEILVKNVTDRIPEYRVEQMEGAVYSDPQLLEWRGSLLLLYFIREAEEAGVWLEGVFPFEDRKFRLPGLFSADAGYSYHIMEGVMFLSVLEAQGSRVYTADGRMKDGREQFLELVAYKEEEQNVMGEEVRRLEEQLREKEAVIESVKVQYDDLMNTAIQYREEAKRWRGKFLTKK